MQDWLTIYSPELAENPPADDLIQIYFMANKWWTPPEDTSGDGGDEEVEPELWECPFPDATD
ncbi:hypothetical protein BH10PSE14_BH10PSE14_06790 [soil metagenome]